MSTLPFGEGQPAAFDKKIWNIHLCFAVCREKERKIFKKKKMISPLLRKKAHL